MKPVKIYLSGPITGMPVLNRPNFTALRDELVSMGYSSNYIVLPHELFDTIDVNSFQWEDYMKVCLRELLDCELLLTLPDWHHSKGANLEVHIARSLNIPVCDAQVHITEMKKMIKNEIDNPTIEQIIASQNL